MSKVSEFSLPHPREQAWMVGHAEAEARFMAEFARGRGHHAYLITGPKGIGKATLAYRLARHVLGHGAIAARAAAVEEAPSFSLFGDAPVTNPKPQITNPEDDPVFRRIAAGSHADLLVISPAYDAKKGIEKDIITVDDARKVPEFLSLTPAEGDWRVVIVDAVDQLNDNAANALLKILEEPPARALLFLICHQPGASLATIRSRCRSLMLTAPDAAQFSEILTRLAPSIAATDHAALYALSYGSPGYAMTLAQEQALKWYEGWLTAMQPGASVETRQKFAESVGASKSPSNWQAVIHCWRVALARLITQGHGVQSPILRREAVLMEPLATHLTPRDRAQWMAQGQQLIVQTETFNLDKKQSVRMLCDPQCLAVL